MKLIRRSELGWPATTAGHANPRSGLVVHYDGSNQGLAGQAHSACLSYWRATRNFHINTNGWVDIGYSFAACPHGYVFEGRGLNRIQAAQPGGNSTYYSVSLMSGPTETPTAVQIDAVRQLRGYLMDRGVAGTVRGHRDFIATSCPGDRAYAMVKDGTFTKAPGADAAGGMEEDMVGLSQGDSGERVKFLQELLRAGGHDLGPAGIDGDYGPATARAVLAARKAEGSRQDFGDRITGAAAKQILSQFVKAHR
ncbi:N-acetylmuramoyl-L-alanine amidase [Marinactinospora rubrisoli]|uniref:N-acetylmuramoyl-L-alanine amidase n=1 Tax=Marinactinospora rubrisoli TaxID=2715399 RepID=A0ABW2KNR8_9ACTN